MLKLPVPPMSDPLRCGLILLAAGESRRMGRPKQLLPVGGQTLLRHVVQSLLAAPVAPFVVVLGAHASEITPTLADLPVEIVLNPDWHEGMGSSLRTGVEALQPLTPRLQGVIVCLADQPRLSAKHLESLLMSHRQTGRTIVASVVQGRPVPPVFFAAEWLPRLLTVRGDQGARSLLQAERDAVGLVPFSDATDLDTPCDYTRFVKDNPA